MVLPHCFLVGWVLRPFVRPIVLTAPVPPSPQTPALCFTPGGRFSPYHAITSPPYEAVFNYHASERADQRADQRATTRGGGGRSATPRVRCFPVGWRGRAYGARPPSGARGSKAPGLVAPLPLGWGFAPPLWSGAVAPPPGLPPVLRPGPPAPRRLSPGRAPFVARLGSPSLLPRPVLGAPSGARCFGRLLAFLARSPGVLGALPPPRGVPRLGGRASRGGRFGQAPSTPSGCPWVSADARGCSRVGATGRALGVFF